MSFVGMVAQLPVKTQSKVFSGTDNYNHNPKEDLQMKNGSQAVSAVELGKGPVSTSLPRVVCEDGCAASQCYDNSQYHICTEPCDYPCPGLINTITCPTTCTEGYACTLMELGVLP
ncbi:hypothetical protein Q8A73_000471 [Channa argus]|nr:hypothetical protein Q8A73_000471 [Channa argus]